MEISSYHYIICPWCYKAFNPTNDYKKKQIVIARCKECKKKFVLSVNTAFEYESIKRENK